MNVIVSTDNVYGRKIIGFDDYIFQHSVAIGRIWDEEVIDTLLEHIADDTEVLDIGANIGLVTLGLLHKAQQRNVRIHAIHCFECDPYTFSLLYANLEHDPHVKMYPFAIGNTQQVCQMTHNSYNAGCNYIYHTADARGENEYDYTTFRRKGSEEITRPSIHVLSVPLDSILYQFKKRISVLKIDIEGFELQALQGAVKLLQMHRPVVLVEIWRINFEPIVSLMKSIGYSHFEKVENPYYPNEDYIFYPN